jgi:hypothetical protein
VDDVVSLMSRRIPFDTPFYRPGNDRDADAAVTLVDDSL